MATHAPLPKAPTHIAGLDLVLGGGLPRNRTSLVCGGPGCGKTILAMEFVANAAARGEPGVFVSFEQPASTLLSDFSSFNLGLEDLLSDGILKIEHIDFGGTRPPATGEFTLDGLFLQLDHILDQVGAERVALDTLEAIFGGFDDGPTLRTEIRRLFHRLHGRGVTSLVTAEAGSRELTRHGLEEYVSDCVLRLDHRVIDEVSTRRARVLKYRGSDHSANEHPFMIGSRGISLIPVGSAALSHPAPLDRVSSGVEGLDRMLGGEGFFRGASVLVSGTAGTGKSSLGAAYLHAACSRGERSVYLAFEESEPQIVRNMASIGIDLTSWIEQGLLSIRARRPSHHGLEQHLQEIQELVEDDAPKAVVVDPISNLIHAGTPATTLTMLTRLVDIFKSQGITVLYTSLGEAEGPSGTPRSSISSLMDCWLEVTNESERGGPVRAIRIIKARGTAHDHGRHRLELTDEGVRVGASLSQDTGS